MGKIRTALSLLASGGWSRLGERWRIHVRQGRLSRTACRPFVYRIGGYRHVCVPGISDSEEMFLTGKGDSLEISILKRWLERGDGFVDIGANLGLYSFCVHQQLGGEGDVVAIEASPHLIERLRESARMLGLDNIRFENLAVGDEEKEVVFYEAAPGQATGVQSIKPDPNRAASWIAQSVRMTTLARLLPGPAPAAVKMDIEGAEVMALKGVPPAWLGADGPLWIVEVNPPVLARFGVTGRDLVAHFSSEAFELWLSPNYSKHGDRWLPLRRLTSGEVFADAWFYNLVAVPRGIQFTKRRSRLAELLRAG